MKEREKSILDDIKLAILANNGGSVIRSDYCTCDLDVGGICEYCAIQNALDRCKVYVEEHRKEVRG